MNRKPKQFEGLDFASRIKLRKELIAEFGSSLVNAENQKMLGTKGNVSSNFNSKQVDLNDPSLYDGLSFDQRLEKRREFIAKYGTSLKSKSNRVKPIEKEKKSSLNNQTSASFESRIKKRKIINQLESNGLLKKEKFSHILKNKDEYIYDPNIIIQESGQVCYISTQKRISREKIEYIPIPGTTREIQETDDFKGSYAEALKRAKTMNVTSFPILYVPWNKTKKFYNTKVLGSVYALKNIMTYNDFFPVHKFLYRSLFYTSAGFNPSGNNLALITLFVIFLGVFIFSSFAFDTPELWWAYLICIAVFALFLHIMLSYRKKYLREYLEWKREALQKILDFYNPTYLKAKHCHVKVGPYGSYLKFIFTHRAEIKTIDPNVKIISQEDVGNIPSYRESYKPTQNSKDNYKMASLENSEGEEDLFEGHHERSSTDKSDKGKEEILIRSKPPATTKRNHYSDEELPTITTDVKGMNNVPEFKEVRVKAKLDGSQPTRISNSRVENPTVAKQEDTGRDNDSDFDDLEFEDASSMK